MNGLRSKAQLLKDFKIPVVILVGIILYLALFVVKLPTPALAIVLFSIFLGSYQLIKETLTSIWKREFALDYIAILAIVVALFTQEYLVAAVLALMISTGRTLEEYGVSQAKNSLTKLIERIPNEITLWEKGNIGRKEKIGSVKLGQEIYVRKGEVIALDGILVSEKGLIDESSLTGEPYSLDKAKGDHLRSGTINIGDPIIIRATKTEENSTYKKILDMVRRAQNEKSPFLRLADKYSTYFTVAALIVVGLTYLLTNGDFMRVLAVLAIATPCPLIIAAPIALLGGVNLSSKQRIIVKKLASLEALSRINTVIFDKTGTITLGKPKLTDIKILDNNYSYNKILSLTSALERSSLHPLAKAIVEFAKEKKAPIFFAKSIEEKVGSGISGEVEGERYSATKLDPSASSGQGMEIGLSHNKKLIAIFSFEDEIKQESKEIINRLKEMGLEIFIFTGDKKEAAQKVSEKLGGVKVRAECTPADKQEGIKELQKQGKIVAMVGDGINDAPALALADVGLVFSNEEQTAASEAADIVFLGGEFGLVLNAIKISKRTINIAKQSILWGIGMSIAGMGFASFGFIVPILGAGLQEGIDVIVILNALRASRR